MKGPVPRPSRFSPKSQDGGAGRWDVKDVAVFCSIMGVASIPISAVIGACNGGLSDFRLGLVISAVIVMIFGSIALAMAALESALGVLWGLIRRAAGRSKSVGSGVYDDWLDGPA